MWIAFSPDGTRIVASGLTLEEADLEVTAAGENPNGVVYERVPGPEDDSYYGSQEFR
jgi:hypothetical protein